MSLLQKWWLERYPNGLTKDVSLVDEFTTDMALDFDEWLFENYSFRELRQGATNNVQPDTPTFTNMDR